MSTELVERLRAHVAELEEKLERESGDLRYAKSALDRETARALKFGKRIDALTAKVALLTEALKPFANAVEGLDRITGDRPDTFLVDRRVLGAVTLGDFRAAREGT